MRELIKVQYITVEYIETYIKVFLILIFWGLCIYLAKNRSFFIETFMGMNDHRIENLEKIDKLIDTKKQEKILLNRCYESERKYEGPGFDCFRVGYYCSKPSELIK